MPHNNDYSIGKSLTAYPLTLPSDLAKIRFSKQERADVNASNETKRASAVQFCKYQEGMIYLNSQRYVKAHDDVDWSMSDADFFSLEYF